MCMQLCLCGQFGLSPPAQATDVIDYIYSCRERENLKILVQPKYYQLIIFDLSLPQQ